MIPYGTKRIAWNNDDLLKLGCNSRMLNSSKKSKETKNSIRNSSKKRNIRRYWKRKARSEDVKYIKEQE